MSEEQKTMNATNLIAGAVETESQGIPVDWRTVAMRIHDAATAAVNQLQGEIQELKMGQQPVLCDEE